MKLFQYAAYVVGAAFVCGFFGLIVANRAPAPAGAVIEIVACALGGWYGYRQAKKNLAPREPA